MACLFSLLVLYLFQNSVNRRERCIINDSTIVVAFVLLMRLVVCPVVIMLLLKGVLLFVKIPYIETIMVISYLASITPSASTVMQFAQIYGKDSSYATAINAVTTVGCIITMPLLIMMF